MTFDLQRFHDALAAHGLIAPLRYQLSVSSTMDLARTAGWDSVEGVCLFLADEQTAGRGRFGRRWVAPAGANLTFTLLLRPKTARLQRLSMVAALAVADGVAAFSGVHPAFKWPNDLQVGGRKLAGILIEAEFVGEQPRFALVGIGLNVNQETAAVPEVRDIAVSLRDLLGHTLAREELLVALLISFHRWYEEPSAAVVRDAWAARLVTLGQAIEVRFGDDIERGRAESVSESGALRLRRPDGSLVELPAGEVSLRPPVGS